MSKRWRFLFSDGNIVRELCSRLEISESLGNLLSIRGIDNPESAEMFLAPSISRLRAPDLFPGCSELAEKLAGSLENKHRIVVYGNYNLDGISGTAILVRILKALGANVHYYIPSQLNEGFGLNREAVRTLHEQGTQTIITVDCGIDGFEETEYARSLGIEIFITDHHQPQDRLPDACAIVNPNLAHRRNSENGEKSQNHCTVTIIEESTPRNDRYPFPYICGAGVALKLAWSLVQKISGEPKAPPHLRDILIQSTGLAALGTISDMVPMLDENRIITIFGLRKPLLEYPPIGLLELLKTIKERKDGPIREEDITRYVLPRMNAAGRLCLAMLEVELLLSEDIERASEIAGLINGMNKSRQKIEKGILNESERQIEERFEPDDPAYVLCGNDWNSALIGAVAERLSKKHHKPFALIARDRMGLKPGIGTVRGVPGINVHSALEACKRFLLHFGGHASAAGFKIIDAKIDEFREAFCDYINTNWPLRERSAELLIDETIKIGNIDFKLMEEIDKMAPFGIGNPAPVFCSKNVMTLNGSVKGMGEGRHFSCIFEQESRRIRAVAFNVPKWLDEISAHENVPLDIAYNLKRNEFNGRSSIEIELLDWKPHNNKP